MPARESRACMTPFALSLLMSALALHGCGASAIGSAVDQHVRDFERVAFRNAEQQRIVLAGPQYFRFFSIDGKCVNVDGANFPVSQHRLVMSLEYSSSLIAAGYYNQRKAIIRSSACPWGEGRTWAGIHYYTDAKAYAAAVAERQRDPANTVQAVQPTRGQHGFAVFLAVSDDLIRRADTLILTTPGRVLDKTDKPGTACALRGATASMGMLGHLDMPDDELLAPDWQDRARSEILALYDNNGGHALFWKVPLRPGMSREEALRTVRESDYMKTLPAPAG